MHKHLTTNRIAAALVLSWQLLSPAQADDSMSHGDRKILNELSGALKKYNVSAKSISLLSPHIAEVDTGSDVIYITADGKHIVVGDVIEVRGDKGVNLKNEHTAKKVMTLIQEGNAITYRAVNQKAQIVAFTDVSCGYCQKLHGEIPALNAKGITVHYLAYPRNGLSSAAAQQMQQAWCSKNPQAALTALFEGRPAPKDKGSCKGSEVKAGFDFGQSQSFTGTPTLLLGSDLEPGFATADEIASRLNVD